MYYYIINPASGFGKINKIQEKLKLKLQRLGISGEFVKTTGRGDATKLAKLALSSGYTTVVAVGGDNTVNEVANGIVDSRACLGVIPTGSTNSLAKTLGIRDWESACLILAARKLETIDLGKIDHRYFISSASIGLEAKIIKYRTEKGVWPKLAFLRKVFSEIFNFQPQEANIELGNQLQAKTKIFTLIVANCQTLGFKGSFKPNPQDGFLDILVVSNFPKWKIFRKFASIIKGSYFDFPETSIFRSKKLKIKTKKPLPCSIDGEEIGKTPIEIEIVPQRLRVIVSKERQF